MRRSRKQCTCRKAFSRRWPRGIRTGAIDKARLLKDPSSGTQNVRVVYTTRPATWTWYFLIGLAVCFLVGAGLMLMFAGSAGEAVAIPWVGVAVILGGVGVFGIRKYADSAKLLETGTRANATVIGVKNTNMMINNVPRFMIQVRVDRPGAPFEAAIGALTYSPAAIGSVLGVCYDPKNVKNIAFADADTDASATASTNVSADAPTGDPAVSSASLSPSTTVELLAQLDKMHQNGVLTDDEFARAKSGVLGNS